MDYSLKVVPGSIKCPQGLGEGVHWDAEKEELLYVDLTGQKVYRYVPESGECYHLKIDEAWVPVIIPVKDDPNKYLVSVGRSIQIMEWDGKSETAESFKTLNTVDNDNPTNWLNDGKCDASGRFWTGSVGQYSFQTGKADLKKGTLYSLGKDAKLKGHISEIDFSNGLTWSPDNRTMYYNDSYSGVVAAFDFDIMDGKLSNRRSVFDFCKANISGVPDGMTADSDGNLWIAMFSGDGLIRTQASRSDVLKFQLNGLLVRRLVEKTWTFYILLPQVLLCRMKTLRILGKIVEQSFKLKMLVREGSREG
ncbi:regucalcin isoform X2 [Folsomia candida]|uniref:regucalcin isoform X2 n=1 Tax=Folsomia candida TaxID=158441 RepID=UPI000B8F6199|nr:regucalcin isoform X2 [Folsomia candida]